MITVIAMGGAGKLENHRGAFDVGHADAALAASIFHFQEFTIQEARQYLSDNDIPVRTVHPDQATLSAAGK